MDDRGELMREKLIEILKQAEDATPCALDPSIDCKRKRCVDCVREASADRLIANGVVISDSETASGRIMTIMKTRDEVIAGLRCCLNEDMSCKDNCPYFKGYMLDGCMDELLADALELLEGDGDVSKNPS